MSEGRERGLREPRRITANPRHIADPTRDAQTIARTLERARYPDQPQRVLASEPAGCCAHRTAGLPSGTNEPFGALSHEAILSHQIQVRQ